MFSSMIWSGILTYEILDISTNSFSKTSISAYPKPGMMLVKLFSFAPKAGFLPVVTDIARLAASFSFPSINLDDE
jgi:hypothetical protein